MQTFNRLTFKQCKKGGRFFLLILCICLLSGCKPSIPKEVHDLTRQERIELTQAAEEKLGEEEGITIEKVSSADIVKQMKTGWNLGNTLDARSGADLRSEINWGCPFTTKEMIQDVINAGFNVIRIPVTWDQHVDKKDNYKINPEWMARVKEVVDYAYDQGVFVILNTHHEDRWLYPSNEREKESTQELTAIWKQIAEYFIEYDEHLLFEGLNEPRWVGTEDEWTGGTKEGQDVVNRMNQAFIDTVRATGGNNKYRHLLITDYGDSSALTALEALIIPDDSRVIVTVHAYAPYEMALDSSDVSSFDPENKEDTEEIDSLMKNLKNIYIDKGIPVIISEYGSRNKDNLKDRIALAKYYVSAAHALGIPCLWWDNNTFEGPNESLGLYNRRERSWPYPEILNAIMESIK